MSYSRKAKLEGTDNGWNFDELSYEFHGRHDRFINLLDTEWADQFPSKIQKDNTISFPVELFEYSPEYIEI